MNYLNPDYQKQRIEKSQTYCLGKEFFERNQKILLWLLNTPIVKSWFRWILRIRKDDCSYRVNINLIEPNNFVFEAKENGKLIKLKRDFRTHNKYSKRLYYAFYPLWVLCHSWDILIANQFKPAWNLGFDTLTVYPAAGANSPVDGIVWRAATESWATLIAGAGTNARNDQADEYPVYFYTGAVSPNFASLSRGIFLFDTSALTSSAVISAAILSLYGTGKFDSLTLNPAANIDIYTSTPASNNVLVIGDYSQVGSTSQTGSPIAYASWSIAGYNAFTFNATGRGNVSKIGISKFGARNANYDVAASAPSWNGPWRDAGFKCYTADQVGTNNDPKLVITYTVGGAFLLNFV